MTVSYLKIEENKSYMYNHHVQERVRSPGFSRFIKKYWHKTVSAKRWSVKESWCCGDAITCFLFGQKIKRVTIDTGAGSGSLVK